MKPIIKYNNGNGAILCHKCRTIIRAGLTKDEFAGKTDLLYCDNCLTEKTVGNIIKNKQK